MHVHPLEKRYVLVVSGIVATMLLLILGSFVLLNIYPPSNAGETIDSTRLHLTAEFAEQNLGVQNNPDGSVVVPLFCNEYCGYGHQSMWGRIVVRPVS